MKLKDLFTKKENNKQTNNGYTSTKKQLGKNKPRKTEIRTYLDYDTVNWLYTYSQSNNTKISKTIREILETYKDIMEDKNNADIQK